MKATLIKIGGSMALEPQKLLDLCEKLSVYSQKYRLIVLPGGGEFADTVRSIDTRFSLSSQTSHRMAILGMDQYGLLLSDLIPNSIVVNSINGIKKALRSKKLPVILPSNLLFGEKNLGYSWDVTSDSLAVYLAGRFRINRVLLITDVDGIFTDNPKNNPNAKLIKKISPSNLLAMAKRTSVDQYLPKLLVKSSLSCYVLNGFVPERIEAVLEDRLSICTFIEIE